MAFRLKKKSERKRRESGTEANDSIRRIRLNFGLSPERPPVIFVKKRDCSIERAGQSETSPTIQ